MAPEQARDTRQATMASDVFGLGGAMLYAATGHAPYHGETVMDVLVRLATEEPDLAGLPPELASFVTACLQRDPRRRPDPAAVLAEMAPYIAAAAGPAGGPGGPGSLPRPVLDLLALYRREPGSLAAGHAGNGTGGRPGEDATFGSQLGANGGSRPIPAALAVPPPAPPHGSEPGLGLRPGPGPQLAGPAVTTQPDPAPAGPGWRRPALAAAAAAGIAVLVAAAAIVGATVARGHPRPAPTVTVTGPPGGAAPLVPGLPPGKRGIVMNQPEGDGYTVFVVHGQGFPDFSQVSVALTGVAKPAVQVTVDGAGTFNYAINQNHEFFRGPLPPGRYHVLATAPGIRPYRATFLVNDRAPPGPQALTVPTPGPSRSPSPSPGPSGSRSPSPSPSPSSPAPSPSTPAPSPSSPAPSTPPPVQSTPTPSPSPCNSGNGNGSGNCGKHPPK
jgi:hypothetical protein